MGTSDTGHAADAPAEGEHNSQARADGKNGGYLHTVEYSRTIAPPHNHRQFNRLRCHLATQNPNNMQRKLVTAEELDRFLGPTADFHSAVMTHSFQNHKHLKSMTCVFFRQKRRFFEVLLGYSSSILPDPLSEQSSEAG